MSSRKSQTGGNTEPLPFVRKWGAAAEDDDGGDGDTMAPFPPKMEPVDTSYIEEKKARTSPSSSRRRRSKTPDSKRRSRSRSSERKRHRKRSRSRDRSSRRSPSHERSSKKRSRRSGSRSPSNTGTKEAGGDSANPMSAVAEAAARAAAIIRMKQQSDKSKSGVAISDQLLVKPEAAVKSEPGVEGETKEQARERRRKSRWSTTKSFVPGMPTILPSDLDETQRQIYLLHMEIEETTRRLRQGDYLQTSEAERSPSPEPIYDANGKRLNTREIRKRQELEQRRHEKIQAILKLNPEYKPPADYRAPNIRLHDKVWIPQEDHPEINFVGLLIGPRGNTLKQLEQETGAKIIIRGKGSVKEGKMGRREGPLPGENEPLHAYITGTDHAVIKKGCEKIKEIINAALMIPDGQNELRKLQLRELAMLNGTLRPEDLLGGTRCSNCGSDQHKTWECPDAPNVTASIVCTACGGSGHIAKDCKNPRPGYQFDGAGMDDEYSALMAELGEKPPGGAGVFGGSNGASQNSGISNFNNNKTYQQKFRMPGGSPIIRVNLSKPNQMRPPDAASYWGGMEAPPAFFGQQAYGAYGAAPSPQGWPMQQQWPPTFQPQQQQQAHPMPVPPPNQSSLSIFPPPPPPPPPVPKANNGNESSNLNAFLAPPPPPS